MSKKLAIDTCDHCGTPYGPLQIVFKEKVGFLALCLACKQQYRNEKQTLNRNHGPRPSPSTPSAGSGQNNRKN